MVGSVFFIKCVLPEPDAHVIKITWRVRLSLLLILISSLVPSSAVILHAGDVSLEYALLERYGVASRLIFLATPLDPFRSGTKAPVLVPLDETPVPLG